MAAQGLVPPMKGLASLKGKPPIGSHLKAICNALSSNQPCVPFCFLAEAAFEDLIG